MKTHLIRPTWRPSPAAFAVFAWTRVAALLAAAVIVAAPVFGQGTAVTYQGRLNDGGVPANGNYDLAFTMFSASTGGTASAGPITNAAVAVSNGLFTTTLDFGATFSGADIWLELAVRTNGGSGWVTLSPRQKVTPTPYALFAESANAAGLTGTIANNLLPANVARLDSNAVFTGAVIFANPSNTFTGGFSGNGWGITNVDLARVSDGAFAWGGFLTASTFSVGKSPVCVAAIDLNGDGRPDLVSANAGTNTLTVLTNNGRGSFVLASSPVVGNGPNYVAAGDLNGDGKPDLVSANYSDNTVTVLTNGGGGTFGLLTTIGVGSGPYCVAVADVNGDGQMDLVTANYFSSTLTVLTNNGAGGFFIGATITVDSGPRKVLAIDVNGDNKVDLVSANVLGNTITVLTNNGSGQFALACTRSAFSSPISLVAMDVNGDGKVDLISGNTGSGTLEVFINAGNGIFTLTSVAGGTDPENLAVADVNGDGKPELVSVGGANALTIWTNNAGTLIAVATNIVGAYPESVAAADLNGDGQVDLITANPIDGTLTVLLNAPMVRGVFSGSGAGLSSLSAANISSGLLADARLSTNIARLNGNGVFTGSIQFSNSTDVFNGNGAGLINVNFLNSSTAGSITWLSNFTGNFVFYTAVPFVQQPNAVVAADINGDGKMGLVSANAATATLTVMTNAGSGFAVASTPAVGNDPVALAAVDVNGDGKVDLVSVNQTSSTLTVLTNAGNGLFVTASSPVVGQFPNSIAVGDFNGDGRVDLAIASAPNDALTVLTNTGGGGFALAQSPATGHQPTSVIAADVNRDGRLDLICVGSTNLTVLTNNGVGGFVLASLPAVQTGAFDIRAADVNGDGWVDLVCGSYLSVIVLTNDHSGNFVLASTPAISGRSQFIALADVNSDGKIDIMNVSLFTNVVDILTNAGAGTFVAAPYKTAGAGPTWIEVADLNGDHGPDLITADANGNTLSVFLNTADPNRPVAPSFHGDGSGLTNLSLSLGANVALLNSNQTFTAMNTFNNPANNFTGNFSGNGSGLTALSAGSISSGTLADARLSANIPLLNASQTFSGVDTFNNSGNSFTGNGAGLTGLSAGNVASGTLADSRLSANVSLLDRQGQVFSGTNYFGADVNITNAASQLNFGFAGRQMLNLWGTQYGIGIQSYTLYFRTDNSAPGAGFAWYQGGTHNPGNLNPGGGKTLMVLDNLGNLRVTNNVYAAGVQLSSDRALKENFSSVDARAVLERVANLPISQWNFKQDPATEHIGPMAQDFQAAFGLGSDDRHISVLDEGGVALAAIQGLNQKLKAELDEKETELRQLKQRLDQLETMIKANRESPRAESNRN